MKGARVGVSCAINTPCEKTHTPARLHACTRTHAPSLSLSLSLLCVCVSLSLILHSAFLEPSSPSVSAPQTSLTLRNNNNFCAHGMLGAHTHHTQRARLPLQGQNLVRRVGALSYLSWCSRAPRARAMPRRPCRVKCRTKLSSHRPLRLPRQCAF